MSKEEDKNQEKPIQPIRQAHAKQDQGKSEVSKKEEEVLAFWADNKIFEKSLEKSSPEGEFVFYDGPPFATGLPHYGSLLPSIAKDMIPRYKTMRGYHVRRRWGWDCHGLPIENMIEKKLDLGTKKDIIDLGVDKFCESCEDTVLTYANEWEHYITRVGRWVEFKDSYKTLDATYIESVWWALKNLYERELIYEGRKVLLYCPRCETPLSKAEIAMDDSYKEVTDEAVTVKFKVKNPEKHDFPENTYLLAWTTTPWTLPANVGLAVGEDIEYGLFENEGENFVLATALAEKVLGEGVSAVRTVSGKELLDVEYEPLYDVPAVQATGKHAHYVMPADFVTTEDGTGIVHTAVIYGEDDYQLGMKFDLPMVPLLLPNAHFNDDAPELVRGQYFKKANKTVIADLKERGLIFSDAPYTHSYPHCYRCATPLIYNAISSWFINVTSVKDTILEHAQKINWIPDHLKDGRFGKILESAPDWTISRNRFWASPLPIWKCGECKKLDVIGSLEELQERMPQSGNEFFVMRHAESVNNVEHRINSMSLDTDPLTEKGREEARLAAEKIKKEKIDIIVSSDMLRTKETAEIVAQELGISEVVFDARLRETKAGIFEGKRWRDYREGLGSPEGMYTEEVPEGENLTQTKVRIMEALYAIDHRYSDKRVLIVSHGFPIEMLFLGARGANNTESLRVNKAKEIAFVNAEYRQLPFVRIPHNNRYELDLHKPYVDTIKLSCECGGEMTRIPEVVDCWVESGSMPFAEHHYPFENKEVFESRFPGDYVVEYVGQTRTWFYYMLVMSSLLFDNTAFKNVLVTGNIQASDGKKMSKSLGNYTDPLENIERYGADALRFYLMSSPVMAAEDIRFLDDELKEVNQRLFGILRNVVKFYETYTDPDSPLVQPKESSHVLDRWILARLAQLRSEVTEALEAYDTVRATRPFRLFVTDLSTWYLRRSRDRFKSDDKEDAAYARATTQYVLKTLSQLMAPSTPFIAEEIYQTVKNADDVESVHLTSWPDVGSRIKDQGSSILEDMEKTREIVSLALEARSSAGVKIRQPLAKLKFSISSFKFLNNDETFQLIKDEVNVKEIIIDDTVEGVVLDTELTQELKEEGALRDLLRHIQNLRKQAGLTPTDTIALSIGTDEAGKTFVEKNASELKKTTNTTKITYTDSGEPHSTSSLRQDSGQAGQATLTTGEIVLSVTIEQQ